MPSEFGAWSTVSNRYRQWRYAGVFKARLEDLIAEAAKRGEVDLSLVSIDSTTTRATIVESTETVQLISSSVSAAARTAAVITSQVPSNPHLISRL